VAGTFAITNTRTGKDLATSARSADNFWTRFWGLMGVKELPAGSGLVIVPCNSIHCFGMKIAIDVVFISRAGEVLHLIPEMKPGRVSPLVRKSRGVIELPVGAIAASETVVGDSLTLGMTL
jgi:uncharacterized membrane protein (UPF0127 family)